MTTLEKAGAFMLGEIQVAELVKNGVITASQSAEVKKAISLVANGVAASKFMTKEQALLIANKDRLPDSTVSKLEKGDLRFVDIVKYVNKAITAGAGIVEVFTDGLDKEVGISNISKGKLDKGENMVLRRVELMYDNIAAGATTKTADYAPLAATDDNALLNGEIELKIAGTSVMKVPTNSFTQPDRKVVGSQANGFNLDAPILITEDDDIQILINFAGTMTSAGGTLDFTQFKLIGAASRPRK